MGIIQNISSDHCDNPASAEDSYTTNRQDSGDIGHQVAYKRELMEMFLQSTSRHVKTRGSRTKIDKHDDTNGRNVQDDFSIVKMLLINTFLSADTDKRNRDSCTYIFTIYYSSTFF